MKKLRIGAALVLLAVLTGCMAQWRKKKEADGAKVLYLSGQSAVYRVIDLEAGVTCYVYDGPSQKGGIHCLPGMPRGGQDPFPWDDRPPSAAADTTKADAQKAEAQ